MISQNVAFVLNQLLQCIIIIIVTFHSEVTLVAAWEIPSFE